MPWESSLRNNSLSVHTSNICSRSLFHANISSSMKQELLFDLFVHRWGWQFMMDKLKLAFGRSNWVNIHLGEHPCFTTWSVEAVKEWTFTNPSQYVRTCLNSLSWIPGFRAAVRVVDIAKNYEVNDDSWWIVYHHDGFICSWFIYCTSSNRLGILTIEEKAFEAISRLMVVNAAWKMWLVSKDSHQWLAIWRHFLSHIGVAPNHWWTVPWMLTGSEVPGQTN